MTPASTSIGEGIRLAREAEKIGSAAHLRVWFASDRHTWYFRRALDNGHAVNLGHTTRATSVIPLAKRYSATRTQP